MQFSDYGYQEFVPRHLGHGVRFQWITEAWDIYRSSFKSWLVLYLLVGGPLILTIVGIVLLIHSFGSSSGSSSSASSGPDDTPDGLAALVAGGLVLGQYMLAFGVLCSSTGLALRVVSGEYVAPSRIFSGMDRWIAAYVFSLILTPVLLVGAVVLGIGVFVAMGLMMPAFALIADGESAGRAFTRSIAVMKGDWLRAALFCLTFTLISIVGTAITFGVGVFVFVPMMFIVSALARRDCIVNAGRAAVELSQRSVQASDVWPPAPTSLPPLYPQANPISLPSNPPNPYAPPGGKVFPPPNFPPPQARPDDRTEGH